MITSTEMSNSSQFLLILRVTMTQLSIILQN